MSKRMNFRKHGTMAALAFGLGVLITTAMTASAGEIVPAPAAIKTNRLAIVTVTAPQVSAPGERDNTLLFVTTEERDPATNSSRLIRRIERRPISG